MAKKIEKFDDRLDIDSGLDMDEFTFEDFDVKDDRKPVIRVAAGVVDGVKAGLTDSTFIRQSIKDVLPHGYGQSMDLADEVTDNIKNVVREAATEMRPAIADIKKASTKLIPKESKLVPKSVQALLQRWRDEETPKVATQTMQREAMMSSQLTEIFGETMKQNADQRSQDLGTEKLKEGIELNRHRDTTDLQIKTLAVTKSLDQYNRQINLPVQKKTLELLHQQLFVQQDTLVYLQQANKRRDDLLATINKNTALPDFVKINKKENLHQIVRNKFYDSANNGLFGDRNAVVQRVFAGARTKAMDGVRNIASGIRAGVSGAEQANDMVGGDGGMSIDGYRMAGSVGGNEGSKYIGSAIASNLREKVAGSWLDKKLGIIDKGNKLETGMSNIPQKINAFRNSSKWDFEDGIKSRGMRLLQTLVPSMQPDMSVDRLNVRGLDDPTSFTKKTDRSINEVIPGFLSRILREVQILRTGEASTELTEFDAIKGKFTSKGKNDLGSFRSIVAPSAVKATQDRLTDMEKFIDTEDSLSPEAKEALRRKLLMNSGNLRESSANTLGKASNYTGVSEDVAKELSEHMAKFFEQMTSEQNVQFSRMNSTLINDVGESRGAIQQQLNLGRAGQLEKMGVLNKDGRSISMDGILEHYLKKENAVGAVAPSAPVQDATGAAMLSLLNGVKNKIVDTKNKTLDQLAHYKQLGFNGSLSEIQEQATNGAKNAYGKIDQDKLKDLYKQGKGAAYANWDLAKNKTSGAVNKFDQYKNVLQERTVGAPDKIKSGVLDLTNGDKIKTNAKNLLNKLEGLRHSVSSAYSEIGQTNANIGLNLNPNLAGDNKTKPSARNHFLPVGATPLEPIQNDKTIVSVQDQRKKEKLGFSVITPPKGLKPPMDGPVDLYVDGETEPRIRAALMAEGEYADRETGEPITTPEDIKGDVVDRAQRIVLTGVELPRLMSFNERIGRFVPFRLINALFNPIAWLAKKAWYFQSKVATKMVAFNYRLTKKAFTIAGKVARSVLGMNGPPVRDVYITGEKEPRLTAVKISAGAYRHQHSNEVLTHQDKIEGTIIDQDNQIVIDESELDQLQVYSSVFKVYNPLKLIPKAIKGIGNLLKGFQTKIAPKLVAFNAGLVKRAGAITTRLLGLGPVDVYVKGNPEAALIGKRMEAGEYFSRTTGAVIKTPNDIDGAVTDSSGEIVLSEDDLKTGITRVDGKPLVSRFFKGVKNIIGGIKKFFSVRTGLKLKSPKAEISEKLGEDLKKVYPGKGLLGKQTPDEKQVSLLQSLVNIAKEERLEKAKEKLLGPNGERVNSFKDKFKKKKASKEDKKEDKKEKDSSGGMLGKLGKMFGGLFGKKEEDAGGGLLSLASKFMMGGGGVAAGAAAGAGATSAAGGAAAATTAAVGAAGATVGTGAAVATGAGVLGTIGAGLLTFLASPVVLGSAALALGGYGIYKGYKYLTRGNMEPVERVRYVQYGFKVEEPKYASKVLALERALMPYLKLDGKTPSIDEKAIKINELMDPFDLDTGNKEEVQLFFRWYQNRFKPVFLTHLIAITALKGKTDISLANSLKASELKDYLQAIRFSNGPYRVMDLPILDKDVKASGPGDVEQVVNDAIGVLGDTKTSNKETVKGVIPGKDNLPSANLTQVSFNPDGKQNKTVGEYNPLDGKGTNQFVPPDMEGAPKGSVAGAVASATSAQGIKMAGGPLSDGRNASSFLTFSQGATIDRLNPSMLKNFYAMVDEYGTATGKKINVNDGYRSYEQQVDAKRRLGDKAATPGSSLHEYGLALDIDRAKLDELEQMGLMRKYGFTRPVGDEPWHMEPAGIQGNIAGYKRSPEAAMAAIENGLGLGGGGYGTVDGARKYGRDRDLAMSLLQLEVKPNVDVTEAKPVQMATVTPQSGDVNKAPMAPGSMGAPKGIQTAAYSVDTEPKPTNGSGGPSRTTTVGNTGISSTGARTNDITGSSEVGIGGENPEPIGKASSVPQVKGAGYMNVKDTIDQAAKVVGYDSDRLTKVIAVESSFNPSASAGPGGAAGLGQFLNRTWGETTGKYGSKYGVNPSTPRTDGRANAIMTAHYLKDGEQILKSGLNRPITAVDNYFAHFLGPYGAKKFLAALQSTPNLIGSNLLPSAAANNRGIFFSNSTARTVSEIYQLVADRINNKVKSFGITPDEAPVLKQTQTTDSPMKSGDEQIGPITPGAPTDNSYAGQSKNNLSKTQSSFKPDQTLPIQAPRESNFSANIPTAPRPITPDTNNAQVTTVMKIDGSVFGTTERILGESLAIHVQVLDVLKQMLGIKTEPLAKEQNKPSATPMPPALKVPSSAINMKRMT